MLLHKHNIYRFEILTVIIHCNFYWLIAEMAVNIGKKQQLILHFVTFLAHIKNSDERTFGHWK